MSPPGGESYARTQQAPTMCTLPIQSGTVPTSAYITKKGVMKLKHCFRQGDRAYAVSTDGVGERTVWQDKTSPRRGL